MTDVMASPVWSIDEGAELVDAIRLMLAHHVARLPVTSGGRLVGMIGRIDICEAALDEPGVTGKFAGRREWHGLTSTVGHVYRQRGCRWIVRVQAEGRVGNEI